jgi:hypothetical protein
MVAAPDVFSKEAAVTRRVVMSKPVLEAAPEYIKQEARLRFEEIAEGLEGIPTESAFWESVRVSRLCMLIHGWSFFYTLDAETLRVTEVRR